MISKFEAIRLLVGGNLSGNSDGTNMSYDDGQTPPTEEQIQAKQAEFQADYDAKQYQRDRAIDYPSWQEQMDLLYHGGVDALKAELKKTKDKFPKPE